MAEPWQIADLARQDLYPDERGFQPPPAIPASTGEGYAGLGGDPQHLATTIKNWWINQPSWLDKAKSENQKTIEAYGRGGMGEIAKQLATDTTEAQDLVSAFGVGNIKGVGSKVLAPGALAATSEYRPPFYSAVEQAVQNMPDSSMTGPQWWSRLYAPSTTRNVGIRDASNRPTGEFRTVEVQEGSPIPGVKPEELRQLGLENFLSGQTGAVPKQAVLGEIAANRVNVGEVIKSERSQRPAAERVNSIDDRLYAIQDEMDRLHHFDNSAASERRAVLAAQERELQTERQGIVANWQEQSSGNTKFSQYTLPGGENYREMLLTLPQKLPPEGYSIVQNPDKAGTWSLLNAQGAQITQRPDRATLEAAIKENPGWFPKFQSSHYDEPNILAHVRYNDRVIDGKKTLFVEEVQSDWHQKGKREGYQQEPNEKHYAVNRKSGNISPEFRTRAELDAYVATLPESVRDNLRMERTITTEKHGVPDAPFKTTWPELAMKRIIREAAEKGYDKVAWTPGSVQAERYDLSKHVNLVVYKDGKLTAIAPTGQHVMNDVAVPKEKLADYIGKDAAEKLLAQEPRNGAFALRDEQLKVGGEGMKGFYDEILPATVNRLVKKHGGRVERTSLKTGPEYSGTGEVMRQDNGYWKVQWDDGSFSGGYGTRGDAEVALQNRAAKAAKENKTPPAQIHTIDITPQLRAQAMKGFPLFTAGGVAATGVMGEMARQDEYR